MNTKIKYFLNSDYFILMIALLLGFLCHLFVAREIVMTEQKPLDVKTLYIDAFTPHEFITQENRI